MSKEALDGAIRAVQSEADGDKQLAALLLSEAFQAGNLGDIRFSQDGYIAPCDTTQWIEIVPSPKQQLFLSDPAMEILYGGQAAGGKSIGLCHAACQYVHVPFYHCIMFRRTKPNAQDLIDKMAEFLKGKAKFSADLRAGRFTFPSGAIVDIGYMKDEKSKFNYKGPEYHRLIFDELTEFLEAQYRYMFSRLRKPKCPHHKDYIPDCPSCARAGLLSRIPLKVMSACNPDGEGKEWVRDRFLTKEAMDDIDDGNPEDRYVKQSPKGDRVFMPASVEENPGLDAHEYRETVARAMTVQEVRELLHGSWRTSAGAIFHQEQFKFYRVEGSSIICDDLQHLSLFFQDGFRFFTVDVAHTSEKKSRSSSYQPSWSVCADWIFFSNPTPRLLLLYIYRKKAEWLDLKKDIIELASKRRPRVVIIEDVPGSKSLISETRQAGFFVKGFNPSQQRFRGASRGTVRNGKLDRSHAFQLMLEAGQVFLPQDLAVPWVDRYLLELCTWHGKDTETSDQVDVSSMAALEVEPQVVTSCGPVEELVIEMSPLGGVVGGDWTWR